MGVVAIAEKNEFGKNLQVPETRCRSASSSRLPHRSELGKNDPLANWNIKVAKIVNLIILLTSNQ